MQLMKKYAYSTFKFQFEMMMIYLLLFWFCECATSVAPREDTPFMSVFSARYGDAVAEWPSLDPNLGRGDGVAVNTLAVGSKGRVVVIGRNGDLVCCRKVSDLSTGCRRSTQKTSIGTRVARAGSALRRVVEEAS